MRKILSALVAIFVLRLCAAAIENSTNENRAGEAKPAIDYREEMRRFVIAISQYGKKFDKNFIVIPQNGLELITNDGSASGKLQQDYLGAISAMGAESQFYGYSGDDKPAPADARNTWPPLRAKRRAGARYRLLFRRERRRRLVSAQQRKRFSFFCCG